MAGTNDFVPHATGPGANALSAAAWASTAARSSGFASGLASSAQVNTALRQSTSMAAMVGLFLARQNFNAADNGDIPTLEANFEAALLNYTQNNITFPAPNLPANSSYFHFGTAGGTATALTANVTPDISAYAPGYVYSILTASASANGGTTANFDAKGVRTVTRADGTPIQKGDWGAGQGVLFFDDGTNLQLFGVLTSSLPTTGILIYSSSATYTVPAGVTKIKRIRCWGAGGGGGGSIGANGAGSGGGGGGYSEAVGLDVVPGQILGIAVGAPGTGGVQANGTAGGTSSVGIQGQSAWLAATGGGFGGGGNNGPQTSLAGAGGSGSGPQLNGNGGTGSYGYSFGSQVGSGIGGASPFGAGSPTLNVNTGSSPGNFPGGGANGGCGGSNGTNGGAGLVILEI